MRENIERGLLFFEIYFQLSSSVPNYKADFMINLSKEIASNYFDGH